MFKYNKETEHNKASATQHTAQQPHWIYYWSYLSSQEQWPIKSLFFLLLFFSAWRCISRLLLGSQCDTSYIHGCDIIHKGFLSIYLAYTTSSLVHQHSSTVEKYNIYNKQQSSDHIKCLGSQNHHIGERLPHIVWLFLCISLYIWYI